MWPTARVLPPPPRRRHRRTHRGTVREPRLRGTGSEVACTFIAFALANVSLDVLNYPSRRRTEYRDRVNESLADVPRLDPVATYPQSESEASMARWMFATGPRNSTDFPPTSSSRPGGKGRPHQATGFLLPRTSADHLSGGLRPLRRGPRSLRRRILCPPALRTVRGGRLPRLRADAERVVTLEKFIVTPSTDSSTGRRPPREGSGKRRRDIMNWRAGSAADRE